MKKVILTLGFTLLSLNAQTIRDIQFDGLVQISPEIAKEIITVNVGEEINGDKVDESIKKLYAQQYFEDIWVDEDSGVLTFHLKEKPIISRVRITGVSQDKEDETLTKAGIKKGDLYDEIKIKNVEQNIKKDLQKQGYYDSVVEVENNTLDSGSVQTNIIINKGENIYIKKITLHGMKHFSYKDIEPVIANKEAQFAGWLLGRNDGKLKADQLKFDSMRIKEFYLQHGFLDVKVSQPTLRTHFEDYSAELSYTIDEGPQYRVGNVDINIDPSIANKETLLENFKLKKGKIFNVTKLRKDISKIRDKVSNKGFAFANIIPDVKQDKIKKIANITYRVIPNKKVYVNNITIAGNSRTMDRVIRRELYLSEGEAFNQRDLKDSQNALKRTGYFNDVQIQPHQISPDKLDLVVNVNEASTGSIMGGISYGSYAGFGINAGISDRNFMGTGIEIGTDIDYSMGEYGSGDDDDEGRTLKGSINFYNPRLFDSLYSLGGNIFKKDYNYINYKEKSFGASLKLGRKITRNIHASLTYLYQDTELTDVDEALKNNIYYQEGKIVKSSLIPSISYDNTDDYYLPRSGIHAGTSIEYAGVGGDAEFLSTNFSLKYYYGLEDLIDYDLILRFKGRVNIIEDNGYLPLNEKLYLGGFGTVRGFRYGSLAPRSEDINNTRGDLVGAKKMAAASFEMSFPLVESIDLRLMTFYDYGTTGKEDFDEIHRSSIGIGIEWPKSPLGVPLQIFYSKTLDDEDLDRTRTIEFNLGRRF